MDATADDRAFHEGRPSWVSAWFASSLGTGIAVGLVTVLLAIGRDVGCSMEDDCGGSSWLLVLAVLAVMAIVAPLVGIGALRGRDARDAGVIAASSFGPAVAWTVAFVVIAT